MAYAEINSLLAQSKIELSAAEAHGLATGLLCANPQAEGAYWLNELQADGQTVAEQHRVLLIKFFNIVHSTLTSDEFTFKLFLPGDSQPLATRAEALQSWCRGFLFGVSLSGAPAINQAKNSREILKDITEFTKLDTDVGGEDDEQAFMEITEYLRAAVLLLRDEIASLPNGTIH